MTGHEQILKMRRAGVRPACIWVMDDDTQHTIQAASTWHEQPNDFAGKLYAHVRLTEQDIPEALDFRFVVGLSVFLQCGRGVDRAKRVFRVLERFEPSTLFAGEGGEAWFFSGDNRG